MGKTGAFEDVFQHRLVHVPKYLPSLFFLGEGWLKLRKKKRKKQKTLPQACFFGENG